MAPPACHCKNTHAKLASRRTNLIAVSYVASFLPNGETEKYFISLLSPEVRPEKRCGSTKAGLVLLQKQVFKWLQRKRILLLANEG